MAGEEHDWDTEGDVVRLIALATGPIIESLDEFMVKLDKVIRLQNEEIRHDA